MMFHVVTMVMVLLADVSLSAFPQLSLQDALNDTNANGLKSVVIKGIAKYKPGGSAMLLSLLIQGQPGIMPGAPAPPGPGSTPAGPGSTPAGPGSTPAGSGSTPAGPGSTPAGPGSTPALPPSGGQGGSKQTPSAGPSTTPTPSSGAGSTTSSPGSGNTGGSFQAFETAALDEHNKFRKVHGSQPMKLNRAMCDEAAAYAKTIANSGRMQHSSKEQRNGQGENLSMGCSTNKGQTTVEAVDNWYNEVCSPGYEFSRGRGQSGTGHFTQVVWNDSVELGIGKAEGKKNGMKCTYIVGRYKPLGNFFTGNEDYKKNVKQGSFNRQAYCSSIKSKGGFKKSASYLDRVLKRKK